MKKFTRLIASVLCACLVLTAAPMSGFTTANAANVTYSGTCGENLTWELLSDGNLTISGSGDMEDYDTDRSPWYDCRASIKAVALSDELTSIGNYSFFDCINLTVIEIPAGVKRIGDYSFSGGYLSVMSLCSVTFAPGSTLESIGESAFYQCYGLTSVEIPAGVKSIGVSAFAGNRYSGTHEMSLEKVVFAPGSKLENIGGGAFSYCVNLKSAEIPAGVKDIGEYAFFNCTNLKSVNFSDNLQLEILRRGLFSLCSSLESVEIPAGVKNIYTEVFDNCDNLTTVTFAPDSQLEFLSGGLFYGCRKITAIELPDSIKGIGGSTFFDTGIYNSQPDGVIYVDGWAVDYKGNMPENTELKIKKGTSGIADCTFYKCENLISAEIPSEVKTIGDYAFKDCCNLKNISFQPGSELENIGFEAFYSCISLCSIEIPAEVKTIGGFAFYGKSPDRMNLSSVTFQSGSELEYIGYWAFGYCTKLTEIEIPPKLEEMDNKSFFETGIYNSQPDGVFYVGSWAAGYKGTMPEKEKIVLKDGTVGIANNAFYLFCDLVSVKIPASVKIIGDYAFSGIDQIGCSEMSIEEVIIEPGSQLEFIGDNAFYNCSALTSFKFPRGVKNIGNYVFKNCRNLSSVAFAPDSELESIGDLAFYECKNLTAVEIPAGVKSIGEEAFYYSGIYNSQPDGVIYADKWAVDYKGEMPVNTEIKLKEDTAGIADFTFNESSELTAIEIPAGVKSIGKEAFAYCKKLNTVTIAPGSRLKSIGAYAFKCCHKLTAMKIPTGVKSIGRFAFYECSKLADVTFAPGCEIESVGENVFYGTKVQNIDIPVKKNMDGDVDNDGNVTAADARLVLRSSVSLEAFTGMQIEAADMDKDGKITAADARTVLRLSVGLS